MKTSQPSSLVTRIALVAVSFLLTRPAPVPAQERGKEENSNTLTAEEIIQTVHRREALRMISFAGELRKGDVIVPFTVNQTGTFTRFCFQQDGGSQIVNIDGGSAGVTLTKLLPCSCVPVPLDGCAEGVCGTDVTWEDLSLRCLCWPAKTFKGEETIKTQRCWVVDLTNPDTRGPYGTVRVSVSDGSGLFFQIERGTLMKMCCFNHQGKRVKTLTAQSGMKVDGAIVVKEMTVCTYAPGSSRVQGRTTLVLHKPQSSGSLAQSGKANEVSPGGNPTGIAANLCAQWATAAGLSGDDARPAAVPHHDGVTNLLKYAFNLSPNKLDSRGWTTGDAAGLPQIVLVNTSSGTALRAKFLCRTGSGLVYTPQMSTSIEAGSWTAFTSAPVRTSVAPGWERVVYHESVGENGSERLFARVEVTLSER